MRNSLRIKMIVFCLLIGITPFLAMTAYSVRVASDTIHNMAFSQLEAIRDVKKHAVQEITGRWFSDLATLAGDAAAPKAFERLTLHALLESPGKGRRMDVNATSYQLLHAEIDAQFHNYVTELGYYDVFLIGPDGRVLYTNTWEDDIGEDLGAGSLAGSGLAQAWREAMQGHTAFVDFRPYAPSNGEPAAFMAAPVLDGRRVVGVVALQSSLASLNVLLTQRSGMGETGETYLVGPDKLMRSDSFLDPQNRTVTASFADPSRGSVDTESSRAALSGRTGSGIVLDYNGTPVLSAYAPVEVGTVRWALVAEIDEAEAFAPVNGLVRSTVFAGLGIAAVVALVTLVFLRRELLRPIEALMSFAGCVAGGDLAAKCSGRFSGELAALRGSIDTMVASLREKMDEAQAKSREAEAQSAKANAALEESRRQEKVVAELLERMRGAADQAAGIAERVSSASAELSAQVSQIEASASVQRDRVSETATAMEQMSVSVIEVARNAAASSTLAENARSEAKGGERVVGEALAAIGAVRATAADLERHMSELGRLATSIDQVMTVISDIADQTNLLALNAAIEAARAGDAGRGFAVVADEVRKLAEKTMGATREVGETIDAIQGAAQRNMASMGQALDAIKSAEKLADESGGALGRIVTLVDESTQQAQGIATAAEEQSAASEQISGSVDEIRRMIAEIADSIRESSAAVHEVSQMAADLNRVISDLNEAGRDAA